MENFAVTESQRGVRDANRLKKRKKITHSLRYDCPDGRLSSIILHVVYPLIRQSYDRYKLYIPDVVVCVKWKRMVGPDMGRECRTFWADVSKKSVKSVALYRLTESCPAGYNNLNMTLGETGGNEDVKGTDRG